MKRFIYAFLAFCFFSWLYCTLFLGIDFSEGGYIRILTEPFKYIKTLSDTVNDIYTFFSNAVNWLKNLFTFDLVNFFDTVFGFFEDVLSFLGGD